MQPGKDEGGSGRRVEREGDVVVSGRPHQIVYFWCQLRNQYDMKIR